MKILSKLMVIGFSVCALIVYVFGQPIVVRNTGSSIDGVEERFLVSTEGKVIRPLKDGEYINFSKEWAFSPIAKKRKNIPPTT